MSGFGAVGAYLFRLFNRNPASNQVVVDLAELSREDRVLDVGFGAGAGVEAAARRIGADRVAAVDPTPSFIDTLRRRVPGVDARVAGAEDVPFADGSFTVIWSIASMHHWDDRDAGLSTLTNKLTSDGRLLIAERLLRRPGHGITHDQIAEVTALLKDLGHTTVEVIERSVGRHTLAVIRARR